ncbi:MAG: BTAD domain-containing putative transcriptional regulator [Betaproteobacteria bacterium]
MIVPKKPVPLAKLTRPKLFGAVSRERLHGLLDERLAHPAVWVVAPPGAGKTTLVAGYLESRRRPALWYQVDRGDADPATFFYYLGLAAGQYGGVRGGERLPVLTPEYLPDLPGFTRRFFRTLFARLPRPSLLVLDNYQEIPSGASTHGVVACALEELPEGVGCVVVCRVDPLPEFARLIATQSLSTIGWDELRLTEPEATAIAAARRITDESVVKEAYQRSGGWVTGLILMLGQSRDSRRGAGIPIASPESVFNYFAGVLFNQLRPETRQVLLATAMLPRLTAPLAAQVSKVQHAGNALRELHQQNYFVDRRADGEPTYQLHALFREFLLERIKRDCAPIERQDLARRSAAALESCGELEEAAALYSEAGDWSKATGLILGIAPALLAQGRWQTLQQRIAALPREHVETVPWLQFWRGASEAAVDLVAARVTLTRAFEAFKRAHDALGQMLAAAAVIESYTAMYDDQMPCGPWIAILEDLLSANPGFPDVESELQVMSSLNFATGVSAPENPRLAAYASRLMPLIEADVDPNLAAPGAIALLNHFSWRGEMESARRASLVARALVANPMLLPMRKIGVLIALAYFEFVRAGYDECGGHFDAAIALAAEHGLSPLEPFLRLCDSWRRLERGECKTVAEVVRHAETALSPNRRIDISLLHHVMGWLALLEGDLARAKREAETSLALGIQIGWTHIMPVNLFCLAEVSIECGEYAKAEDCVRRYRARFSSIGGPSLEFHAALVDAYGAERQGEVPRCEESLRLAFGIGRTHGLVNNLRWYPPMMARLAGFALEHGIETEYARMLIRRRGLVPETPLESWPWALRIYTLGRFEILKDDEPIAFAGKAQHKPLDLLKVLLALGGKDVSADKLIGILWPSPPEDGGQKAFEITVHRLRKLLGADDAVQVTDRHATLNPRLVWVDAWALERMLSSLVTAAGQAEPGVHAMEQSVAGVLKLYRGHFLAGDGDEPWQIPVRNRLSGRFQRFVLRLGEHWEMDRQWPRAAELYERAIELDPLAETFYRRQMICLHAQGRRAEAIEVFRRCRQTLSVTLGVAPTRETEAVHVQLLA